LIFASSHGCILLQNRRSSLTTLDGLLVTPAVALSLFRARQVAPVAIKGSFKEEGPVRELAAICDVLTVRLTPRSTPGIDSLSKGRSKARASFCRRRRRSSLSLSHTHMTTKKDPLMVRIAD